MRAVFLLALLIQPPALSGEWVGPLELSIQGKRGPIPTRVSLALNGTTVTGDWRSVPPNTSSGTISGTLDNLTVVFNTGGVGVGAEHCIGEAKFSGRLTASGMLRLTAKTVDFDLPGVRVQGRDCANVVRDLVWTLQRR